MIERVAPEALVRSAMVWCPDLAGTTGAIIAGGFVRAYYAGEKPSDMDLYFRGEKDFKATCDWLERCGWLKAFETDRAISYSKDGKKVQCISYIYGLPGDIIKAFDFTVCPAALTIQHKESGGEEGIVFLHDDFFEHLAGRVLVYTGSPLPLASLKRAFKYTSRGYHLCDENLIRIVSDIDAKVDFTSEESIAQHIAGMDPNGDRRVRVID